MRALGGGTPGTGSLQGQAITQLSGACRCCWIKACCILLLAAHMFNGAAATPLPRRTYHAMQHSGMVDCLISHACHAACRSRQRWCGRCFCAYVVLLLPWWFLQAQWYGDEPDCLVEPQQVCYSSNRTSCKHTSMIAGRHV